MQHGPTEALLQKPFVMRYISRSPYRVVEAQHIVSTRKLVDSDAEHRVLESLLEASKPRPQDSASKGHPRLHYLLFTPFRYPPLPHGSRFGSAFELGIWYGSESIRTALSEVAYYRLVFLEGTKADLGTIEVELSSFRVKVATPRGIDFCKPPYDTYRSRIASKTRYDETQAIGKRLRENQVEIARYPSARDEKGGHNLALFTPAVFREKKPRDVLNWTCFCTKMRVDFVEKTFFERRHFEFERASFLVDGTLPSPAL